MLKINNKDIVIFHFQKNDKKFGRKCLKGVSKSMFMGIFLTNCLTLMVYANLLNVLLSIALSSYFFYIVFFHDSLLKTPFLKIFTLTCIFVL